MANSSFNLLKIRASYGTAGNDRILILITVLLITPEVYMVSEQDITIILQLQQVKLVTLTKWETIAQTNVGVDFGVWNNRLSGTFDVYEKTTDLFQSVPISLINATSQIQANSGSMTNKGVEGLLRYTILDKMILELMLMQMVHITIIVLSVPGTTENL